MQNGSLSLVVIVDKGHQNLEKTIKSLKKIEFRQLIFLLNDYSDEVFAQVKDYLRTIEGATWTEKLTREFIKGEYVATLNAGDELRQIELAEINDEMIVAPQLGLIMPTIVGTIVTKEQYWQLVDLDLATLQERLGSNVKQVQWLDCHLDETYCKDDLKTRWLGYLASLVTVTMKQEYLNTIWSYFQSLLTIEERKRLARASEQLLPGLQLDAEVKQLEIMPLPNPISSFNQVANYRYLPLKRQVLYVGPKCDFKYCEYTVVFVESLQSQEAQKQAAMSKIIVFAKDEYAFQKRKGQIVVKIIDELPLKELGFLSDRIQAASKKEQNIVKNFIENIDYLLIPSLDYQEEFVRAYPNKRAKILAVKPHFLSQYSAIELEKITDIKNEYQLQDKRIILADFEGEVKFKWDIATDYVIETKTIKDLTVEKLTLLAALSDLIITDYNGKLALLNQIKPVYLYQPYKQSYTTANFSIAKSLSELEDLIQQEQSLNIVIADNSLKEELIPQVPCVKIKHLRRYLGYVYKLLFRMIAFLPKQKRIIFESFGGTKFADNPKALYDYALANYSDYELVWLAKSEEQQVFKDAKVPYVLENSLAALLKQARAKYWIVNARQPLWKKAGKGTKILQTWHGTPLKKLGLDIKHVTMPGTSTKEYHQNFIADTKKWDYLIAPNEYSADIFTKAFAYPVNKLLLSGYPRNDRLFNYTAQEVLRIKQRLGITQDKKIILYAPTWRDNENYGQGNYYFDLKLDLDAFSRKFPDVILLIRAHYLIAQNLDLHSYDNIIDVSFYQDITDLYLISDLLITDYSSVFFDYANLKRPMIFFAYDYEEYASETRGFYFDYQDVPGPIVTTNNELFAQIAKSLANFEVDEKYQYFVEKFCSLEDGNASARVFDALLNDKVNEVVIEDFKEMGVLQKQAQLITAPNDLTVTQDLTDYYLQVVKISKKAKILDCYTGKALATEFYYITDKNNEVKGWVSASDVMV